MDADRIAVTRQHRYTRKQLEAHRGAGPTLAQRLEDARLFLKVHGYLRDSESDRIKAQIAYDWNAPDTACKEVAT